MALRSKNECPLVRVRRALHWERNDLAALGGVDYAKVALVETGYHSSIPSGILAAITPYLAAANTTPEKLQEEFRAWRQGLGEEVRKRTAAQLKGRVSA